jgi:hypothetical protein
LEILGRSWHEEGYFFMTNMDKEDKPSNGVVGIMYAGRIGLNSSSVSNTRRRFYSVLAKFNAPNDISPVMTVAGSLVECGRTLFQKY